MARKLSIMLFIFLLVFQTMISGSGLSTFATASETEAAILTDVHLTDENGKLIDSGENPNHLTDVDASVQVHVKWSFKELEVTNGDTYSFKVPQPLVVSNNQQGTLVNADQVEVGTFKIGADGIANISLNEEAENHPNSEGTFQITSNFNKEKIGDNKSVSIPFVLSNHEKVIQVSFQVEAEKEQEEEISNEDIDEPIADEAEENEETSDQEAEEANQQEAGEEKVAVEQEEEAVEEKEKAPAKQKMAAISYEAVEIKENIITDFELAMRDGSELPDPMPNPHENELEMSVKYAFELDNNHSYGKGSTFTFQLPEILKVYNEVNGSLGDYGTYAVSMDGEVVFTFNENIESDSSINGWIEVYSFIDRQLQGSPEKTITVPIKDGADKEIKLNFKPKTGSAIDKRGVPNQQYNGTSITWEIDFNKDLSILKNAELLDPIDDENQKFTEGSIKVYELDVQIDGTVEQGKEVTGEYGNKFPINFGNIDKKAYRVVFETEIIDEEGTNYPNTAKLKWDGDDLSATASVGITRGKALEKSTAHYDSKTQIITWKVKYNYNEKLIPQAEAFLLDELLGKQAHELIEDSVKVFEITIDPATGNETDRADFDKFSVTKRDDEKSGFKLQFDQDIDKAYEITYQTKASERVYDGSTVTNKVEANGKEASSDQWIWQEVFHKSHIGDINYDQKTTKWGIRINTDSHEMENAILTDRLPKGLTLVEYTISHGGNSVKGSDFYTYSYDEASGVVKFEFNETVTKEIYITYTTEFDHNQIEDGKTSYINDAHLTWMVEGDDDPKELEREATFTPNTQTQLNGSKGGSYNAKSKEITWTIGVNYNNREINEAIVEDIIQGNQHLVEDSIKVYEMKNKTHNGFEKGDLLDYEVENIDEDGQPGFRINLGKINSGYVIEFKTSLEGKLIIDKYENTAVLRDGEKEFPLKATVSITNGGNYTNKAAAQNKENEEIVNWTVNINGTQSTIQNAVVTDKPSANQLLLKDSLQLYSTVVDEDGNYSKKDPVSKGDYDVQFKKDEEGNEYFELLFLKEINHPYILEYNTFSLAAHKQEVSNNVNLTGKNITTEKTDSQKAVEILYSGGDGGAVGKVGNLEITKVDAEGDLPLKDVEFTLFDKTGEIALYKGITDEEGKITFSKLRYTNYVLKETGALEGYVVGINSDQIVKIDKDKIEMTVKNKKIKRHVELTKTDGADRTPLEGVVFELYKDGESTPLDEYTTDRNGKILIEDLEAGDYFFKEVAPLEHYQKNDKVFKFTIEEKQTEIDKVNVKNELIPGKAKVKKVDSDDTNKPLSKAVFQIFADGNLDKPVDTITTNDNGEATTKELRPGKYVLKEVTAPYGYELSSKEIEFEIERSNEIKTIDLGIVENKVKTTKIELVKKDSVSGKTLHGAKFELIHPTGEKVTGETDESGKVSFENLKPGKYQIKELESPAGYILNESSIKTEIDIHDVADSSVKKIEVKNGPLAKVTLKKVDAETRDGIKEAVFDVIDPNSGETVEGFKDLKTDSTGELVITGLPEGTYQLKETKAPFGYQIKGDGLTEQFTVKANVKTEEILIGTVENEILTGSVELLKKDANTGIALQGVEFELQNLSLVKGGTFETKAFTTNEEGKILVNDLRPGKYKFVEVKPQTGYQKHWKDIEFDIEFGKENQKIELDVENYKLIDIEVTKKWQDENEQDRPKEIKVELYQNDTLFASETIKASENWAYTFENLNAVDASGKAYSYEIKEVDLDKKYTLKGITGDPEDGFVITNVRTGKTSVKVTKAWKDEKESDRPEEVKIGLYQNENLLVQETLKASKNWEYTFENLEAFDTEGKAYTYTVKEVDVDEKYALEGVTGDAQVGFVITNVRVGKTTVEGTKTWKDDSSKDRPDMIKVNLLQNDTVVDTQEVTAEDDWNYQFSDLEKYDEDGVAYEYAVTEHGIPGYKSEVTGYDITNTRSDKTSVKVTKGWKDDNSEKRPQEVTVNLLQNREVFETVEVKASENWTYEFTGLEAYDEEGIAYEYTVEEVPVEGYETTVNGYDITNLRVGKTAVEGVKTWLDDNSEDRPEKITVNLLQNGKVHATKEVTAEDDWTYRFSYLEKYDENGKAYQYTVEEEAISGYKSTVDGHNITNLRAGKTFVEGTKTWLDDDSTDRPEVITVNLLQNGEEIDSKEVTADSDWKYSFADLDQYDSKGVAYQYTVEEEEVEGYETSIKDSDITNLRVGKTAVEGTKTWKDDNSTDRPEVITVNLLQNGEKIDSKDVTAESDWKYSFADLDQYDSKGAAYKYTVEEEAIEGYETSIKGFEITNLRVGKTAVEGTKTWKDDNSKDRPDVIVVNLLQNGTVVDTQEVTAEDDWNYQFSDLEKYDEDGVAYEYTVKEHGVPGYKSDVTGYDITNTRSEKTSIKVTKGWKDDNSEDRPQEVIVNILQNGEIFETVEVKASEDWTYEFNELEAYDENGVAYEYAVEEVPVDGYETTVNGYDITNLRVGKTAVEGAKTWLDDNSQTRPEVITVNLLQNGKKIASKEVTAESDWKYSFADLDQYDTKGAAYQYTVEEEAIEGYETSITGFDLTNLRVGKTSVEGTKTWLDDNSTARPEVITVNLHQNGKKIASQEVTAELDWKYSFTDLEKYDSKGVAYQYTVEEEAVEGYETSIKGFEITNLRVGKTSVEGTKTWLDDNSTDRPEVITVNLLQNEKVIATQKVTAESDWKYSFTDLEKYDSKGVAYQYTVEEEAVEGYETSIKGFDITNLRVGKTSVEGTKTWKDDNSEARPEMIKVNLLQNGTVHATQEVTAEDDWKYHFSDLEKYDEHGVAYEYTVKEHGVPGYKSDVTGYDITNTRSDQTSVIVTKGWKDDDSESRPETVTVNLLQNGEVFETVVVKASEEWTYEFTGLEAYDEDGVAFEYAVEEVPVEGYETIVDGYDITNLRVGKTAVEGTKTWDDSNYKDRPEVIKVDLLQNGEIIDTKEVTAEKDWKYSFTDLDQYDVDGKVYTYTIQEQAIKGYESIVSGYDLINKLIYGAVELIKVDSNDQQLTLKGAEFQLQDADGNVLKEKLTTDENGKLSIGQLQPGVYSFIETKAPEGYELDPTPIVFTIELDPEDIVTVVVENNRKQADEDPKPEEPEKPEEPGKPDVEDPQTPDESTKPVESKDTEKTNGGKGLPKTATSIFNYALIGLAILLVGIMLELRRRRSSR